MDGVGWSGSGWTGWDASKRDSRVGHIKDSVREDIEEDEIVFSASEHDALETAGSVLEEEAGVCGVAHVRRDVNQLLCWMRRGRERDARGDARGIREGCEGGCERDARVMRRGCEGDARGMREGMREGYERDAELGCEGDAEGMREWDAGVGCESGMRERVWAGFRLG